MKKLKVSHKFFSFIAIFISVIVMLFAIPSKRKTADSELSTVGYKYTVSEYNGKVAVFVYGEQTPETILDCRIDSLPESDAQNLRKGIHINNDTELQSLIEAFD
ncbi:MAG: BofC C-terminal domain-containing protein [Clostridia bacterium]|nr:BofC C-terminal domain-containing protein [Clostridia bacterium]